MAARVGPSTPLRNRYTHGEDPIETRLPSGRCNYTNLSSNGTAPVCGCRRFWDKALAVPGTGFGGSVPRSQTRSGFCMCGHHACYHDDNPQSYVGRVSADVTMAEATPTIPQKAFLGQASGQMQNPGHEVGRQGTLDTLQWGRYTRSESVNSLPAIPSQCLLPSDTASITSGSQAASIRPSGIGRTFNPMPTVDPGTASGQQSQKDTRIQMYEDANGNLCMQSLTEAATPSARASQDPVSAADLAKNIHSVRDALGKYVQGNEQLPAKPVAEKNDQPELNIKHGESLPGLVPVTQHEGATEATLIPRLRHLVNNLSEYPTKIQNHETRLGLLENTTFHHPEIEDLHDADDRLDNRVCEIEERIRDVEKAQAAINDASSVGSRQIESFDSRVSATSSAMIVSAMNRLDFSRLEALEAQIAELRAAALPSHSRPWEVEVVFLPFGSRLMGIWSSQQSMSQRSRVVSSADDSWTQSNYLAAAQACLTAHDQSSAWERSATNLSDQDPSWLMARACGHDLASPSDHFSSAAPSPNISTTPKSIPHARPISSIKERNPFRPLRVRTTSMPLSTTVPIKFSEPRPSSKRRIASVDRAPSPSAPDPPFPSNQKRRHEDISEQAGRENSDDELDEPGSATDEFYAEGEEEGYEKNYISEAELRPGQEQERQAGEEWEGVEDKCELNHSAILHSRSLPDRRAPVAGLGLRLGEDDGEEDKGSDVSSVPSEYPSRQPEHYFELGPTGGIESSTGKAGFMIHVDEEASF
ncbi:hypothetical protein BUE80_DR013666 [Diplocarpon rosae]|nr:hypothetical protein BUE80_DR013666 [Diplocarpon rosae]